MHFKVNNEPPCILLVMRNLFLILLLLKGRNRTKATGGTGDCTDRWRNMRAGSSTVEGCVWS